LLSQQNTLKHIEATENVFLDHKMQHARQTAQTIYARSENGDKRGKGR